MKRKHIAIIIFLIVSIWIGNIILTELIEYTNIDCKGQKFSTVEDAIQAWENEERKINSTSLDYCPPYELLYTFDYEKTTIAFISYCDNFDGEKNPSYLIRTFKHNNDGTLSFDSGFANFHLNEPTGNEEYYYFTNIDTSKGSKAISFLYLDKDSDKDIYFDGVKSEKLPVTIKGNEFYICYAVSNRRDTFLSNLLTIPSMSWRHKLEIK